MRDVYHIGTEVYINGKELTNACHSTFHHGTVIKRVAGWIYVHFDDDNTFPFRASKLDEHARLHSLDCIETLLSAAASLDGADALLCLSPTAYVVPKPGGKGLTGSFVRTANS
jgi:hypothetical protein